MTIQNRKELLYSCVTSSLFISRKYKTSAIQIHFPFLKLKWHRGFRNCTRFLRNNNTTARPHLRIFIIKWYIFTRFGLSAHQAGGCGESLFHGVKSLLLMKAYLFSVGTNRGYECLAHEVIQIPEYRKFCLWNPESWVLESEIQLKESGIPLIIGIHNPSSTDKD